MRGPQTWQEALQWAQEAIARSRYFLDPHFEKRSRQRNFTVFDAKRVIASATTCDPYLEHVPRHGGSCWRIHGLDTDGTPTGLGVELFRDHLGKVILMITLVDES